MKLPVGDYERAVVVAVTVLCGTALVLALAASPVMAASLSIDGDTIETDRGRLTSLELDLDANIDYDGSEAVPGETEFEIQVKDSETDPSSYETIRSGTVELEKTDVTTTVSWKGVNVIKGISSETFDAGADGTSTATELDFRLIVTSENDIDGDGQPNDRTTATSSATITVQNQEFSGDAGGSGEAMAAGV